MNLIVKGAIASALFSYFFLSAIFIYLTFFIPILPLVILLPRSFRIMADFICEVWIGIAVRLIKYCGTKTFIYSNDTKLDDPSIIIMNHKNQLDWFFYMVFADLYQNSQNLKFVIKNSLKHVPILGWAGQLFSNLFLKRNIVLDQIKIENYIDYMKKLCYPLYLLIFCEGTNMESKTIIKSNQYAKKNGLQEYRYVLHPRTKGFACLVQGLRGLDGATQVIETIYDCTIAYKGYEAFGDFRVLLGQLTDEVHIQIERICVDSLPASDEELQNWLIDRWALKENSLANFYENGSFLGNPPLLEFNPPRNTFLYKFLLYNFFVFSGIYFTSVSNTILYFFLIQLVISYAMSTLYGFDNFLIDMKYNL